MMTKAASKTNMLEGKIVEVFIESITYRLKGNWEWDLHCDAVFCSDVMLSMPAAFSGTGGIIHPDDLPDVKGKLVSLKGGKPVSLQFRIITTYGETKTLSASAVFLTDHGRTLSEQGAEERLLKELGLLQLQKELDHYQALNEIRNTAERRSAIGTWYFNTATHVAWYSDNVYRMYGIPAQGLNAHLNTFSPFIHPDDRAIVAEAFDRAYKAQVPLHLQFRIISSDGSEKHLHQSIRWTYSAKGERIVCGLVKDETEEKLQESRMEDLINENYFQKQFVHLDEQAANLGHWYINLLTRKVVFSDTCFRLHGLKIKTATSGLDTFIHFVHVDDQERVQQAYRRIRNEHILPELEYRIVRADGKTRHIRQQGKTVVIAGEIVVMGFMQDVTPQKLAEKNILELKEASLLRRFSETEAESMAKLGNWLWEIQTGKIIWSDGLFNLLGYKPASIELTQKHFQKLVNSEDRKQFSDALALVVKEKRETEFEFRLMRLGTIRHIRASFKIKDYEGRDFFLATFRDCTEEYEMRRQLGERIQLTELFTENIQDRAFITDSNNTVLLWNKACEEVYKIKREAVIGKNFFDVFPQSKNEEQIGLLNLALNGETVFRQQVRSNSGNEYHDLRMLPLRNEQGDVLGIMHVLHDVTKEHQMQQNLTERLQFIESLLTSTIDRIIVLDRNMNYQYWNNRAEMYYGIKKEEVVGKNILELFPAFIDDPSYGELRKALRGETIHIPATQNLKEKKGYYETYLIPLKNERQEVTGILWITHDLSSEWQLQRESMSANELLQATMDATGDMIQVFEAVRNEEGAIIDFKWILINHAAEEIYGDVTGESLLTLNPGVVEEGIFDTFKKVVETGVPDQSERYYVHEQFNGWFYQSAVKLNDGLVTTTRDITRHKTAEQEVEKNKNLLQSVFDTSPAFITVYKPVYSGDNHIDDFEIVVANPFMVKAGDNKNPAGGRFKALFPASVKNGLFDKYIEVMQTGHPLDFEIWYEGDGMRHWFRMILHRVGKFLVVNAEDITERKKVETELQKNLAILQHTEELAQIGSWEYEPATGEFHWSEGMYSLFGLPNGMKVTPQTYLDFALDQDRPVAQRIVHHIKTSPAAFEEVLRIKKDSATCLLKVKGSVVHNEKGEPEKVIGVDLDITELQKAEDKVKESEDLLEQTAKATPDAINIFDLQRKQSIHLNDCLAGWIGITNEEMRRMGYQGRLELVHPDDRVKLVEFNNGMSMAAAGETRTIEYRLQTREGKTLWIRDRSKVFKTDEVGRPTHLLSVLQDFTEEVQLRNRLLERTQYAETIIDTSVDRIMVYDVSFSIIGWNKRSEEVTGVRKDQALGKNLFELFPKVKEDEILVNAFKDSLAGAYVHLPPKKSTYTSTFYERFYIPLKDETGQTYAVLNIMHDISDMVHQREELKELNQTLEKKNKELEEKNEEISSFAFIASHDLKEPLRKLYTFSDWLLQREGESLSETGKQYIKKIANSVRRMDMLIEDVLVLAKIGSDRGVEMTIDLNAVLERVLGDMKDAIRQKGAEIIAEELPVIKGNSNQLFYLFKNLVSNAIKFQEADNQPVLRITSEQVAGSEITTSRSVEVQDYYKISFEDNGLGFEDKYVKKIFQVFQRLHHNKDFEGTGMGLAICRKIMENHSGFIRVKSEPGKGSVFSCYFPVF
ncbi:MAG TPA: PAS domain S-box protein [Flavisolibacter sp.]|nr:PAS domain S-box protein [Flavisolibacter sp.]